jgi:tetratricopeptide (TPR) repeat protein
VPDGWEILKDPFADGAEDVCACLWMVLRDVQQWMSSARRERMFGDRSHKARARILRALRAAPALAPALRAFMQLRTNPAGFPAGELGAACYSVWGWAEGESLLGTAAHYAEAAAYLVADNPAYANDAGWACRRCTLYERAGVWYQRAFRLAVRSKNRHEAIRALLGRGTVYKDLGRSQDAREFYDRASRRAVNTGRRRQAAVARHYIFALEAEHGTFDDGLDAVRETLNLYPIYDRRVPYLAHDYAFLLIRHRYFGAALGLLEKLAPAISKPEERVLVQSAIARTAAAIGRYEQARAAAQDALETAKTFPQYAHASLVHIAYALRSAGEWDAAAEHVASAEQMARVLRDAEVERVAAELRQEITKRVPPERENRDAFPYAVELIEKMFSIRLRRWLAPDRRGTEANATAANAADRERRRL